MVWGFFKKKLLLSPINKGKDWNNWHQVCLVMLQDYELFTIHYNTLKDPLAWHLYQSVQTWWQHGSRASPELCSTMPGVTDEARTLLDRLQHYQHQYYLRAPNEDRVGQNSHKDMPINTRPYWLHSGQTDRCNFMTRESPRQTSPPSWKFSIK